MLVTAQENIQRVSQKYDKAMAEAFLNRLFATGGPTSVVRNLTPGEVFFGKIFSGYHEIESAMETLEDIEVYLRSFPYRNSRITKARHLRYHVENSLNEVYLLRERLKSYLTTLGRSYRGDPRHDEVLQKTRPLFRTVDKVLNDIITIRGRHVHLSRFNDIDLDRVASMELLATHGSLGREMKDVYQTTYRMVRKHWKTTVGSNIRVLRKFLDVYGDVVHEILFHSATGKLRLPR